MKALLLPLLLLAAPLAAEESYLGSAAIEAGDLGAARRAAVQDARVQAGERNGLAIRGSSDGQGDRLLIRNAGAGPLTISEEWREGDLYHVRAREERGCRELNYRKRIAAVAFPIARPDQVRVDDVHGFEQGLPHEILRRLAVTGEFLTRGTERFTLYDPPLTAPDSLAAGFDGRQAVVELADRLGADYILSGVVRDLGLDMPRFQLRDIGYIGRADRRIELELFVHDGHTGALLLRHGYADEASGEVVLDRRIPFGSRRFFESDLGEAFDRVLRQAVAGVAEQLRCHPFTARIIRVSGDEIVLDAGADSRIQVGDELIAYGTARDQLRDRGGRTRGPERREVGKVTIVQVAAEYAVARLNTIDPSLARLQPGDLVATR